MARTPRLSFEDRKLLAEHFGLAGDMEAVATPKQAAMTRMGEVKLVELADKIRHSKLTKET